MNLVDALMEAIKNDGKMPDNFEKDIIQSNLPKKLSIDKSLPIRITDSNFAKYSKVISSFSSFDPIFRTLPFCHLWNSSPPHFSKNASFELDLKQYKLDVIEIERLLGPRMLSNFDAMLDENAANLPADDYSVDSEILGPQIRTIFYFLIILFFVGAAIVARPRSFAQFLILRPIRVIISFWYKISNYF
uniref:Uncharacterized protein n=1 Tax=Panagrolaimus sp. PS1159 TaxID=55785 RepID=A0AC35G859_9BILA